MSAPKAIDQARVVNKGKRRTSGRAWSTLAADAPTIPNSVSAMPAAIWPELAGCSFTSWTNSRTIPATATSELQKKRRLGLWPRKAQASRLDGMSSSANTVATTPEVMCRSAR